MEPMQTSTASLISLLDDRREMLAEELNEIFQEIEDEQDIIGTSKPSPNDSNSSATTTTTTTTTSADESFNILKDTSIKLVFSPQPVAHPNKILQTSKNSILKTKTALIPTSINNPLLHHQIKTFTITKPKANDITTKTTQNNIINSMPQHYQLKDLHEANKESNKSILSKALSMPPMTTNKKASLITKSNSSGVSDAASATTTKKQTFKFITKPVLAPKTKLLETLKPFPNTTFTLPILNSAPNNKLPTLTQNTSHQQLLVPIPSEQIMNRNSLLFTTPGSVNTNSHKPPLESVLLVTTTTIPPTTTLSTSHVAKSSFTLPPPGSNIMLQSAAAPSLYLVKTPITSSSTAAIQSNKQPISIGSKLMPTSILPPPLHKTTSIKPSVSIESPSVTTINKLGLNQIPKDTIVKQIMSKDVHGGLIDLKRMVVSTSSESKYQTEPSITIMPKTIVTAKPQASNSITTVTTMTTPTSQASGNFVPLCTFLSKDSTRGDLSKPENPTIFLSNSFKNELTNMINIKGDDVTTKRMINLQIPNSKLSRDGPPIKLMTMNKSNYKFDWQKTPKEPQGQIINISNGLLSNTHGPIKILQLNNKEAESPVIVDEAATIKNAIVTQTSAVPDNATATPVAEPKSKNPSKSKLKNKILENVKKSPRTAAGRSKSLTLTQNKKRKLRKQRIISTPPLNSQQTIDYICNKIDTLTPNQRTVDENIGKLRETLTTLNCDENLDDSSKSKSVSPISNSKTTDSPVMAPPLHSFAAVTEDAIPFKSLSPPVVETPIEPITIQQDYFTKMFKWRSGIGYLCQSRIHFKKNEFGLVDLVDDKDFSFNQIDPHFERIINKQFLTENLYKCKVCMKPSTLPELCSIECSSLYTAVRNISSNTSAKENATKGSKKKTLESTSLLRRHRKLNHQKPASKSAEQTIFNWDKYLKYCDGKMAPVQLFINPYPSSSNMFEVRMKLEAIDPEHCSLFCVCTIVDKLGYRIKLHFDGYSARYDFWINADSMDIFPPGWCAKTGRKLKPPRGYTEANFEWNNYLTETFSSAAPRIYFTHLNSSSTSNPFKVGMKLEAEDLKSSRKICVCTVGDVLENRILVKFDGFDLSYDYWTDITSPYIHPINFHNSSGFHIRSPPEYANNFNWTKYLADTKSVAVPESAFCSRNPIEFENGMKLEIVDKKVPQLIRPATVLNVVDYEIKVLFDGWPSSYAYWIDDDNADIHPVGWCYKTGHPIEMPLGYMASQKSACGVLGCKELGNATNLDDPVHNCLQDCPYESRNWSKINLKSNRMENDDKENKSIKRKCSENGAKQTHFVEQFDLDESIANKRFKIEPNSGENSSSSFAAAAGEHRTDYPELSKLKVEQELEINDEIDNNLLLLQQLSENCTDNLDLDKRLMASQHLLQNYGPSMLQIHKLWKQNSLAVMPNDTSPMTNPMCWTCNEVCDYVRQIPNCSNVARVFIEQDINGSAFLSMSQQDLINFLELRVGPSIKIYNQIVTLREEVNVRFVEEN